MRDVNRSRAFGRTEPKRGQAGKKYPGKGGASALDFRPTAAGAVSAVTDGRVMQVAVDELSPPPLAREGESVVSRAV